MSIRICNKTPKLNYFLHLIKIEIKNIYESETSLLLRCELLTEIIIPSVRVYKKLQNDTADQALWWLFLSTPISAEIAVQQPRACVD